MYTMTQTVSVRLSAETLSEVDRLASFLKTDRSEALRRFIERGLSEAKIEAALNELRRGHASIGYAARMAGLTLYEMMDLAAAHKVPWTYQPSDRELRAMFGPAKRRR